MHNQLPQNKGNQTKVYLFKALFILVFIFLTPYPAVKVTSLSLLHNYL